MSIANPGLWIVFGVLVFFVLSLDLFVLGGSKSGIMKMRTALGWSIAWITLAFLFNLGLWLFLKKTQGPLIANTSALNFLAGYILEKALSVDNLFIFLLIFSSFNIPALYQRRVLLFGVIGAIFMRIMMIAAGTALIKEFAWILLIFGAFLLFTGMKMLVHHPNESGLKSSRIMLFLEKHLRLTSKLHQEKFFIRQKGLLYGTPLFLALILIEFFDLVFATDSIPAVFAITTDPFIVATSNIFAILGLRALYFLLAGIMNRFHYLRHALASILILIGLKLLLSRFYHISPLITLTVIAFLLALGIIASLLIPVKKDHE